MDAARRRVEELNLLLPLVERAEAEALAETRAKLDEERRKRLSRALRELLKHSLSFSAHYKNAASAFKRMTAAGNEAARLLPDEQRNMANGSLALRLSAHGLKLLGDQEINRIGLLPALHGEGEASAPGTNPASVDLHLGNAPHQLPALEAEIRRLTGLLLAGTPEPQESGNGADLPQVAIKAKAAPTAARRGSHGHCDRGGRLMAYREPTRAELEAAEREIMKRRGERILAAEVAAKAEAQTKAERIAKLRADPTTLRVRFDTGIPRLTDHQVAEVAAEWRARYGDYDDELRAIQEQRLKAALQADGYTVPEMSAADRLSELKARQRRES